MRAVVLIYAVAVAVVGPVVVDSARAAPCTQVALNLNNLATQISQGAASYWAHRANFIDLIFGPSSQIVPNASQVAEQEKSQAEAVKAGVRNRLASLRGLLTAAQAQGCPSPVQLLAMAEPAIKLAKRVNFDQFPEELPESVVGPGPPRMPQ